MSNVFLRVVIGRVNFTQPAERYSLFTARRYGHSDGDLSKMFFKTESVTLVEDDLSMNAKSIAFYRNMYSLLIRRATDFIGDAADMLAETCTNIQIIENFLSDVIAQDAAQYVYAVEGRFCVLMQMFHGQNVKEDRYTWPHANAVSSIEVRPDVYQRLLEQNGTVFATHTGESMNFTVFQSRSHQFVDDSIVLHNPMTGHRRKLQDIVVDPGGVQMFDQLLKLVKAPSSPPVPKPTLATFPAPEQDLLLYPVRMKNLVEWFSEALRMNIGYVTVLQEDAWEVDFEQSLRLLAKDPEYVAKVASRVPNPMLYLSYLTQRLVPTKNGKNMKASLYRNVDITMDLDPDSPLESNGVRIYGTVLYRDPVAHVTMEYVLPSALAFIAFMWLFRAPVPGMHYLPLENE